MLPPEGAVLRAGRGPTLLCIHGTGTDRTMWQPLVAQLQQEFLLVAYDRQGVPSWPVPANAAHLTVQQHADDAADLVQLSGTAPVVVCAASFGAVVAFELMARHRHLISRAILFEPSSASDPRRRSTPSPLTPYEPLLAAGDFERVAEAFFHGTMGVAAWRRLPEVGRSVLRARGRAIALDLAASSVYRMDIARLAQIEAPVLLVGGGRSRAVFEPVLAALAGVLPNASRKTIASASHALAGQAWSELAGAVRAFAGRVTPSRVAPFSPS